MVCFFYHFQAQGSFVIHLGAFISPRFFLFFIYSFVLLVFGVFSFIFYFFEYGQAYVLCLVLGRCTNVSTICRIPYCLSLVISVFISLIFHLFLLFCCFGVHFISFPSILLCFCFRSVWRGGPCSELFQGFSGQFVFSIVKGFVMYSVCFLVIGPSINL